MSKITIKNSVKIIDDKYVIKKKQEGIDNLFKYLSSRSFNNYPHILNEDNTNIYYEYIKDINEPEEQKIIDLVTLLSILHNKTTIYKEVDLDNYKLLYEKINKEIDDTYNYYDKLMNIINSVIYMSPSNYLIARNSTMIFNALIYSKNELDHWYKLIKNKRKVRVVTLHNNIKLEHYLNNNKPYLISWDHSKIDIPIFDLISLYKNHYLDFDFINIFKIYFNKYPYTKEEMILFLILISIPYKIKNYDNEYKTVISIRKLIDYLYKSNEIVKEFSLKEENIEKQEDK